MLKIPRKPSYAYTTLGGLEPGTGYNLYGVVSSFTPPRKTRGTDYVSSFSVVDETSGGAVNVVLFAKAMGDLCAPTAAGDIVRLHRVRVQQYNDRLQIVAGSGFSHVLVTAAGGWEPETSSRSVTWTEGDQARVAALRAWAETSGNSATIGATAYQVTVGGMEATSREYADLLAQVVERGDMEHGLILHVWDGTVAQRDEVDGGESTWVQYGRRVRVLDGRMPWVGTVLPIFLYNDADEGERTRRVRDGLQLGTWVRFRNLRVVRDGMAAKVDLKSTLAGVAHPDRDMGVRAVLERVPARLRAVERVDAPPTTIGEILARAAHVIAKDLVVNCVVERIDEGEDGEAVRRVILRDATGSLPVLVPGAPVLAVHARGVACIKTFVDASDRQRHVLFNTESVGAMVQ